jgi:hypothetical protein
MALFFDECLAMRGKLKPLVTAPASLVSGNHLVPIKPTEVTIVGYQSQGGAYKCMGHRVSIGVELNKSPTIDRRWGHLIDCRQRRRQWQQAQPFLLK